MADQVTWAEAREVVQRALAAEWTADRGALYVAEDGREDATHYLVVAGAASLVDGPERKTAATLDVPTRAGGLWSACRAASPSSGEGELASVTMRRTHGGPMKDIRVDA